MGLYPRTIQLLISLNKNEYDEFRDYLKSPYHNKIDILLSLFNLIIKKFQIQKETYCEVDLLNEAYDKPNLSTYKSHLQKLKKHFENFVMLQQIEKEENLYNQLVLEDYLHRKNGIFFESKYKQATKTLSKSPRNIYHYHYQYKLDELLDSHIKLHEDKRVGDSNLQAASDAIDKDFLLKKLCFLVLMQNRQSITTINYNFGFKPYIIDYLQSKAIIEEPLINLFYQAYQILTGSDKKSAFQKLNLQLQQNDQEIDEKMEKVLFLIIQNNLKQIIEIEADLHQQLFDLYKIMLDKNHIQTDGKLQVDFYRNVVSIGLELGEFDYVQQFIEGYKYKLMREKLADKMYAYNKAKFLIYTGKPEQARELIINLHFDDAMYKFDLKCLQMMVFYELKEYNLLISRISNMRIDLTPKRSPHISDENRMAYKNFINIISKLHHFSEQVKRSKNDILQLIGCIEKTNHFANRKWLLMKANELL